MRLPLTMILFPSPLPSSFLSCFSFFLSYLSFSFSPPFFPPSLPSFPLSPFTPLLSSLPFSKSTILQYLYTSFIVSLQPCYEIDQWRAQAESQHIILKSLNLGKLMSAQVCSLIYSLDFYSTLESVEIKYAMSLSKWILKITKLSKHFP